MGHSAPGNGPQRSDERYWYLREVQDLLMAPDAVSPSQHQVIELMDPTTGEALLLQDVCCLWHTDAVLALDAEGRSLHLLQGLDLHQTLKLAFGAHKRAVALCASDEHAFVAFADGQLVRFAILSLFGCRDEASVVEAVPFEMLPALRTEIGNPGGTDLARLRMLPLPGKDETIRLLFYGGRVVDLAVLFWATPRAHLQSLPPPRSGSLAETVEVTDACVSRRTGMVYLADAKGGRIVQVDPARVRAALKVVAGDGVVQRKGRLQFGPVAGTRLGAVQSLCEYEISEELAQHLSAVVLPGQPSEWQRRGLVTRSSRASVPQHVSFERLVNTLHGNGSFLVALDDWPLSFSVSLPDLSTGEHDTGMAAARHVWPLLPASPPAAMPNTFEKAGAGHLLHGKSRVRNGPHGSLLFWSPQGHEVVRYAPETAGLISHALQVEADRVLQRMSANNDWTKS